MSNPILPGFALSAGLLWLLAGALYKLFDGSPMDLPAMVTDLSPLGTWETMRAAIIVELAVVGLVIAKPRIGWFFLAATFAAFLAVLYPLVQEGADSCGCFGSTVTIAPTTMMAIDGGLLLLILISRPWRMSPNSGLGFAGYLPLLAAAVAAPMLKLTEPELPGRPVKPDTEIESAEKPDTGLPERDERVVQGLAGGEAESATIPVTTAEDEPDAPEEEVFTGMPEFFELRHDQWEGKSFDETDIAAFADQSMGAVLPNSHVVVYRQTCSVCKAHLEQLWEESQNNPDKWTGENQLVLIRIVENKDETEENLCTVLPEPSQKVSLPALKRGYGIKTPMSFDVNEAYTVQNVVDLSDH